MMGLLQPEHLPSRTFKVNHWTVTAREPLMGEIMDKGDLELLQVMATTIITSLCNDAGEAFDIRELRYTEGIAIVRQVLAEFAPNA